MRHGETRTRIDRDRLCFCTVSHTGSIGSIGRPGGHGFLDRAQGAGRRAQVGTKRVIQCFTVRVSWSLVEYQVTSTTIKHIQSTSN